MLIVHPDTQNVATETVEAEFLCFFRSRGYAILPGSPLVDESIKMSFLMSAGLVQVERATQQVKKALPSQ